MGGKNSSKSPKYMCDLETTTNINDCHVWAWGMCEIGTNNFTWGKNLDSFFQFAFLEDCTLYFHNLKFDMESLMCWLFTRGYSHSTASTKESPNNTFGTLISGEGRVYSMWIKHNGVNITVLDSYKLISIGVAEIGPAYKLGESKGIIDYTMDRPVGYNPTPEEIEYLKNDVIIVAKALHMIFTEGLTKNTQASNALFGYKKSIGGGKVFDRRFPQLPIEIYDDIKQSYKGGWCYCNPLYKGQIVGAGNVYDKNSMYPWVMKTKPLPFGEPVYYEGEYQHDPAFPLYIAIITLNFELKEGFLPTIQLKHAGPWNPTDYLTSSDGEDISICVTSIDWEIIKKHYHTYNVVFRCGYKFRASTGMFDDYIDEWYSRKESASKNGEAGPKQAAKIMLNSLYGKFGKSPYMRDKIPHYENGKIKYTTTPERTEKGIYVPLAAFVTAYARESVIQAAQDNYKLFLYSDTDSVHLLEGEVKDLEIDNYKLGAWKQESHFTKAKFLRAKTYAEEINGKLDIKCAGLPKDLRSTITLENFKTGQEFWGKFRPVHACGGVVLVPGPFKIRD